MTLPPFNGPRGRQATATLPGAGETAVAGAGASRPGAPEALAPAAGGVPGAGSARPAPDAPGAAAGAPAALGGPGAAAAAGAPGTAAAASAPGTPGAVPPVAPRPAADGESQSLNLARRSFVNTRPVVRAAAILWVLGLALLAANLTLFRRYLTSSQTTRGKLAGIERDVGREKRAGTELRERLGSLNLEQQNREVTFLNRKIDERTFSWSLLFTRMAKVLPDQVRLLRLRPSNVVQKDSASRSLAREAKQPPVVLAMHCEAKDDEALLRFVDNMFAHPAFAEPNLENEDRDASGLIRFNVTVQYQPNADSAETAEAEGVLGGQAPKARMAPAGARPRRPARTTAGHGLPAGSHEGGGGAAGIQGAGARAAAPLPAGGLPAAGTGVPSAGGLPGAGSLAPPAAGPGAAAQSPATAGAGSPGAGGAPALPGAGGAPALPGAGGAPASPAGAGLIQVAPVPQSARRRHHRPPGAATPPPPPAPGTPGPPPAPGTTGAPGTPQRGGRP